MNGGTIALRQSQIASLAALGRMSPMERWLFGLGGLPTGEAVAEPQHAALHDVPAPRPARVRRVLAHRHVGRVAPGDQSIRRLAVHDDHAQAQAFQPPAERVGEAPDDAAPISPAAALVSGPAGCLGLGAVAVGPADPVVQFLLCDAEGLSAPTEKPSNALVARNDDRPNSHLKPQASEPPRSLEMTAFGAADNPSTTETAHDRLEP